MREDKNINNEIDFLIRSTLKKDGLNSPSSDFTDKILGVITKKSKSSIYDYKPLLSKRSWILIAITIGVVLTIVLNGASSASGQMLDVLSRVDLKTYFSVPSLEISTPVIYGLLSFSLLLILNSFVITKQRVW